MIFLHRIGLLGGYPSTQYLLDLYGGAAAAYSLRVLSSSFASSAVVRVRRSSDNAEADFTATEITDGTLTTWTGANDGFVVTWYDQSGNSRDATQATAGSQPQIVSSGVVVTGGINFSGKTLVGGHNITSAYSIFSVQDDNGSTTSYIADTGINSSTGVNYGRTVQSGSDRQLTLSHGAFPTVNATGFLPTGQFLLSQLYDSTTISAFVDGGAVGTSVQGYNASGSALTISGVGVGSGIATFTGPIAELIAYPSDQSANRTGIEGDIATHYFGPELLLDTYSGAAAAYSLRNLTRWWTGRAVVRVRRSSDNAEADFTATEITDGTLTTWTGANDGFVTTWYDQSGNANDATQATAGNQPQIVSSGSVVTDAKGNTSVNFDGTDSALLTSNVSGIIDNVAHSVFCVSEYNATTTNFEAFVSLGFGTSGTLGASTIGGDTGNLIWFGGDDAVSPTGGSIVTSQTYLLTKTYDGSLISGHVNGGSANTASAIFDLDSANQYIALGGYADGSARRINGKVTLAIFYLSDQSANRTGIETNINDHYSIY